MASPSERIRKLIGERATSYQAANAYGENDDVTKWNDASVAAGRYYPSLSGRDYQVEIGEGPLVSTMKMHDFSKRYGGVPAEFLDQWSALMDKRK